MEKLRLLSWNVNGLRAVLNKGFFPWLNKEAPDILGLQETRTTLEQLPPNIRTPSNYRFYLNAAAQPGYSGVALFTKKEPLTIRNEVGIKKFDTEGRVLIAEFPSFQFYSVYFPNGKMGEERLKYKMAFYDMFLLHVNAERKKGKNLVICGDFNTAHKEIDLAHPKENTNRSGFLPMERAWIDKFVEQGYVDTFRLFNKDPDQYTWWDLRTRSRQRNVGWRIDYFFINEEFVPFLKEAFILPEVMGSDHCPVGIVIEVPK